MALRSSRPLALALFVVTFGVGAACSAAPDDAPAAPSPSVQTSTDTRVGTACDAQDACAAGTYCAPARGTGTCGAGTCRRSPGACPLLDTPVCGCDGETYMNACFAEMGRVGQPGTTSTGEIFVQPKPAVLEGTWSRAANGGTETLLLNPDSSYSLRETCSAGDCSSSGTYTITNVGILLDATQSSNAASLATEFYLEETCPIGGPLQLVGAEPEGSDRTVVLHRGDGVEGATGQSVPAR